MPYVFQISDLNPVDIFILKIGKFYLIEWSYGNETELSNISLSWATKWEDG